MPDDVTIDGFEDLEQELARLEREYPQATAEGMFEEGHAIMTLSKRYTPVRTGRLRDSGYVAPPVVEGDRTTVELGYGVVYALAVHEATEKNFRVGMAKFLETAWIERMVGYTDRMISRIRGRVKTPD